MRNHGFSLIELMVVVAIIGILAAIAIPNYNDYVLRSRIVEALSALSDARVRMEQYFQDNRSYASGNACALANFTTSGFSYACTLPSGAQTYLWAATGTGRMIGFSYTINQVNARTSTIAAGAAWPARALTNCWVTSRSGC